MSISVDADVGRSASLSAILSSGVRPPPCSVAVITRTDNCRWDASFACLPGVGVVTAFSVKIVGEDRDGSGCAGHVAGQVSSLRIIGPSPLAFEGIETSNVPHDISNSLGVIQDVYEVEWRAMDVTGLPATLPLAWSLSGDSSECILAVLKQMDALKLGFALDISKTVLTKSIATRHMCGMK